ncbi:MAG: hypothetical protein COV10_00635 [Candidatus Vogelbacteria bacterium CG10_big_fil_rev_8_21_14_0_10_51_16]|uniref:Uncharacterized protein n=1 Tax=Candidatus Vogelbacteria bacterium CG10_big_fil_rev_8_21_14_0_10_51_16 TaxID=1975045 RepID=A0A2H0RF58_9BACT|nr:MAG: hypothetical protein COV10_00635 [Candidatus Vogelbacteria bacterium CG10_big_fil_rev_8_21_14_0_10_51_16]
MGAFSDPLTISFKEQTTDMLDLLTHELIHRISFDGPNEVLVKPTFFKVLKPYEGEPIITQNHIVVHAAETAVILKVFGEARLQRKMSLSPNPDYIRAWELVQARGYQDILDEFIRLRNT